MSRDFVCEIQLGANIMLNMCKYQHQLNFSIRSVIIAQEEKGILLAFRSLSVLMFRKKSPICSSALPAKRS